MIEPAMPTGFHAFMDVGGETSRLHFENGAYRLETANYAGVENDYPARFPFAWDELVVKYDQGATQQEIDDLKSATGAEVRYVHPAGEYEVLGFPGFEWWNVVEMLTLFRHTATIAHVFPNPVLGPGSAGVHDTGYWDDPGWSEAESAYMADVGLQTAWASTTGSREVVVGLFDAGLDINHPDLVNNLWVNTGELPETVCSVPFIDVFDLDGDGVFTLHDLNEPDVPADLATALTNLSTCEGVTLSHTLFDASETYDDGLYQGSDLIRAFRDGADGFRGKSDNGREDDFFGLNAGSGAVAGVCPELPGDVYPFDTGEDDFEVHGLLTAGLIGADRGTGGTSPASWARCASPWSGPTSVVVF